MIKAGVAAILLIALSSGARAEELHGIYHLDSGVVLPYPLDNLFRGWVECTGRGHHKALDIGGVGPDAGLGSVVRALGPGKVTQIGMPEDDPARFGTPLTGVATVVRSGTTLPAHKDVPGYGKVWFFTRDYGRHRSGGVISIRVNDGPLAGHDVHYLHLAAARRDLKVGDEVAAGDELGLLGGTAVLDAPPHLHLSIELEGRSVDVGNTFGIGATRVPCRASDSLRASIRARYSRAARILMEALRKDRARNILAPATIDTCGPTSIDGHFSDGAILTQRFLVAPIESGLAPFTVTLERLEGKHWQPRVQIEDSRGNSLFTGTLPKLGTRKRFTFESLSSGRRGVAAVTVTPKRPETVAVKVGAWPVHKRALKGATWRLTIDRACP